MQQIAKILVAAIALMAMTIALPAVVAAIWLLVHNSSSFWASVTLGVLFIINVAYYVLLFFAMPQFYLLLSLGLMGRALRLAVGVLSGWLFLLALYSGTAVSLLEQQTTAFSLVPAYFNEVVSWHFITGYFAFGSPLIFVASALVGMFITGLFWSPIYRLSGIRRADWDSVILSGRPPYAR